MEKPSDRSSVLSHPSSSLNWRILYFALLAELAVLVVIFYALTKWAS